MSLRQRSHHVFLAGFLLLTSWLCAGATIPKAAKLLSLKNWKGTKTEVIGLKGNWPTAVCYPDKDRSDLTFQSNAAYAPGSYRLYLKLRSSHSYETIAWHSTIRISVKSAQILPPSSWQAIFFANPLQPEIKTVDFVLTQKQPLIIKLSMTTDSDVVEKSHFLKTIKSGKIAIPKEGLTMDDEDDGLAGLSLTDNLDPAKNVFCLLEEAAVQEISDKVYIKKLNVAKLRYKPGETLKGYVTIARITGKPVKGKLRISLEHDVDARDQVKQIPVELKAAEETIKFEFSLPKRELGYALIVEFVTDDDKRQCSQSEYFNIVSNIYRTAIHYVHPIGRTTFLSEDAMDRILQGLKDKYVNCQEVFFWGEEDMVELSPDDDYWFSGQTCYHMCKKGLQDYIRAAHEKGIAVTTYGKFIMSGYLGWKTAYDHPYDHKKQYGFGVGMWEGADVPSLDRFKNKEFTSSPPIDKGFYSRDYAGLPFMPINPDPTPGNVRRAAEEIIKSIDMFGWDAVRWDGHPRGAGTYGSSCGGARNDKYSYDAQKKTQMLVRYFKDIIRQKYPDFQYGYNYFLIQNKPFYEWAYEDFELDELCQGGGLVMNESIRNSQKRTFEWLVRNLQVEGDLARERDGLFLSISCDDVSDRDTFFETILYYAGGTRAYSGAALNRVINRYATRFSKYVFDETMRRIDKPEQLLKPRPQTSIWWQPFVFETQEQDGRRQLVINLLNIPREETISADSKHGNFMMAPGTKPFAFNLTLPDGFTAETAHLIDPFTLKVTTIPIKNNQIPVPAVNIWKALVVDLKVSPGTPALANKLGPPATLRVKRPDLKTTRKAVQDLDTSKSVIEVNKQMEHLFVKPGQKWWNEEPKLASMSMEDRNTELLKKRKDLQYYLKHYPYGVKIPQDQKLKDNPPKFANLAPERNGLVDIFYARGAMDYKLNLYDGFARLDRFHIREARFFCPFGGKHFYLENNISPRQMEDFDVLLYADITHAAVGVMQAYAMVDYVRNGGGVIFYGGEYSFGKGRSAHTILDRELLPVTVIQSIDNRYVIDPLYLEPGKDFKELGVNVDFGKKPAFWCWNEVGLKDMRKVKIFLKSGNRPILVGWDYGKGRVACFMAMYRGLSDEGNTAFFDWEDWPRLTKAVLNWLAPDAYKTSKKQYTIDKKRLAKLSEQLEGNVLEDLVDSEDGDSTTDLLDSSANSTSSTGATTLKKEDLAERISLLDTLIKSGESSNANLIAEQLSRVGNFPYQTRLNAATFLKQQKKLSFAKVGRQSMRSTNPHIRGSGIQMVALSGDAEFPQIYHSLPPSTETKPEIRDIYQGMALVLYPKDDLRKDGAKIIEAINRREQVTKMKYTKGKDFSMAAPETLCLESGDIFKRICWLAYMSRYEPEKYAQQYAREWGMLRQYREYCDRNISGLRRNMSKPGPKPKNIKDIVRHKTENLRFFKAALAWLGTITLPEMEKLFEKHPNLVCKGFQQARFLEEIKQVINLLGRFLPEKEREQLGLLTKSKNPFLASFAKQRLKAGK